MTIFVYKGLTRNPEIGNIPVWVLPNIWRLDWVSNNKFRTNVANEKLLNAENGRVTASTQSRAKCVYYDFFGTFFLISETYQVLVLNLKWISLKQ